MLDMTISNNDVLVIMDDVKTRIEDFGLLLVSKSTPAICLNDDAKTIWEMCDGNNKVVNIIGKISCDGYEDISEKVLQTLQTFVNLKLMKVVK